MASATTQSIPICLLGLLLLFHLLQFSQSRGLVASTSTSTENPVPATWPEQFHSVLFINRSGSLQKTDLWYDWPNGRNFNIIQHQLGVLTYDLEWDNGTSFYYTLHPFEEECKVMHFDVGILRPNWLDGANYLGQQYADNFLCNVWEKVDFISYYEDVITRRPVKWIFFSGMVAHVITFEVGAVLEDSNWQAPVYCFNASDSQKKKKKNENKNKSSSSLSEDGSSFGAGTFMRGIPHTAYST